MFVMYNRSVQTICGVRTLALGLQVLCDLDALVHELCNLLKV